VLHQRPAPVKFLSANERHPDRLLDGGPAADRWSRVWGVPTGAQRPAV